MNSSHSARGCGVRDWCWQDWRVQLLHDLLSGHGQWMGWSSCSVMVPKREEGCRVQRGLFLTDSHRTLEQQPLAGEDPQAGTGMDHG